MNLIMNKPFRYLSVCGNSMAVPVMSWIGERIQKHIDGKL